MDPWKSKKRPCEEDTLTSLQRKRAVAVSVAAISSPLLPQPAGYYPGDSHALHQRRLPPLSVFSDKTSAEPPLSRSVEFPTQVQHAELLDNLRLRSQSLVNIEKHADWHVHELSTGKAILFYMNLSWCIEKNRDSRAG
jgi:hypothetical protein